LIDVTKDIEAHIEDFLPTRVFIHSPHDPNIDHRIAYKASLAALRPVRAIQPKAILAFEVLSSTEWNPLQPFAPTMFFDIGGAGLDKKIEALAAYGDEMRPVPHPRSQQVIRGLAAFRGSQVGVEFGEAFILVRGFEA
jgi:LmbE family N-acetylglucosaminyl deacetylase